MSILPLSVCDLTVRDGSKRLIGPINLELPQGGITVLIGPNGAGKTTLMKTLNGLRQFNEGKISWASDIKTARRAQAFVFQNPVLLNRSVLANIIYPLRLSGLSKRDACLEARAWVCFAGLEDLADRPALLLSGGEQQKLAIARALSTKPSLLFLDEPCVNLDGACAGQIEAFLQETRDKGTTIFMVSHNMGQVRRLAARILFMYRGKILEDAPAAEFFSGPKDTNASRFIKGELLE